MMLSAFHTINVSCRLLTAIGVECSHGPAFTVSDIEPCT